MRVKAGLVLVALILALVTVGCTSPSTTPNGYPCTDKEGNCYYFISNGTAKACHVGILNFCENTTGPYYDHLSLNGKTYLCKTHDGCLGPGEHAIGVGTPQICSPKFAYNGLANDGQAWEVVKQQADQNATQRPVTIRFTSTSATTVTASLSVNVSAHVAAILGVVFASVHAQVNASVTRIASTVVGNSVTVNVPAGATANGIYGVRVQVTRGHLYQANSCGPAKPDYGNVQTYVPITPGWCVWLSGQPPCRVVSKS